MTVYSGNYGIHFYSSRQIQSQTSQDCIRKQSRTPNLSPQAIKHLWIRTALTEKVLDKIVLYLVENSRLRICSTHNPLHIWIIMLHCLDICFVLVLFFCSKFYEREALLRDPVDGPILASLLGIELIILFQAYYGQQSAFSYMVG